jgi:hypothetical protein
VERSTAELIPAVTRGAAGMDLEKRQLDVGLTSPFGPRFARPKRRTIVPRAERLFAPVEFTLEKVRVRNLSFKQILKPD